jgi:hypothetical protein
MLWLNKIVHTAPNASCPDLIRASTEAGTPALNVDGRVEPGHDNGVGLMSASKQ